MPSTHSSSKRENRPDAERRGDAGSDRGFTITEVVIAIALLGVVALSLLQAVTTSIKASSISRSAAQVETTIVNAADRVNRAGKSCNYERFADAAAQIQGWEPTTVSVTHEYYVPGANSATAGTWVVGTGDFPACPGASADVDLLVQRVTITITSPDGGVRRSIQVVKSDV